MAEDRQGDVELSQWRTDHPEERLPSVFRTLLKLRVAASAGIVASLLIGLLWAPLALLLTPVFTYLRYHLPGCLRTLVSSINSFRTRELPDQIESGTVISVFAYSHRDMPTNSNVLLAEVLHVGQAGMESHVFEKTMNAMPVLATETDADKAAVKRQVVGVVRVLSEPIGGTEQLAEGEVSQGDRGIFFVEDGLALLAGQAPVEE